MILRKTSIFPASREAVYDRLRRLKTLQYISAPYASFTPIAPNKAYTWREGAVSSYYFKLFGIIPLGRHTIKIEHFDQNYIQSRESNPFVPVWDHLIILKDYGDQTEYTDEVVIQAGWKTVFIWLWVKAFYTHRQRKWIRLLTKSRKGGRFSR